MNVEKDKALRESFPRLRRVCCAALAGSGLPKLSSTGAPCALATGRTCTAAKWFQQWSPSSHTYFPRKAWMDFASSDRACTRRVAPSRLHLRDMHGSATEQGELVRSDMVRAGPPGRLRRGSDSALSARRLSRCAGRRAKAKREHEEIESLSPTVEANEAIRWPQRRGQRGYSLAPTCRPVSSVFCDFSSPNAWAPLRNTISYTRRIDKLLGTLPHLNQRGRA